MREARLAPSQVKRDSGGARHALAQRARTGREGSPRGHQQPDPTMEPLECQGCIGAPQIQGRASPNTRSVESPNRPLGE